MKDRKRPGHFIREWRRSRGLTQVRLAERAGMVASTISQLENGIIGYTQPTLEALAYALSCEPGDLLSRDPRVDGMVLDLMRLIRRKDQATVAAIINGLPDARDGTDG